MKEKEKDFDTLASDILIELYNDIKEHETDLMEEGNLDAAQDEMIRLAQSGENPHTALPGVARKHGIDVAVLKKAIFGENEENWPKKAAAEIERKGTEGEFTKYCDGDVTQACVDRAARGSSTKRKRQAAFAANVRGNDDLTYPKKSK